MDLYYIVGLIVWRCLYVDCILQKLRCCMQSRGIAAHTVKHVYSSLWSALGGYQFIWNWHIYLCLLLCNPISPCRTYTSHKCTRLCCCLLCCAYNITLISRFMGPTWGPPESCQPQIGPMSLAIWASYQFVPILFWYFKCIGSIAPKFIRLVSILFISRIGYVIWGWNTNSIKVC